MQKVRPMLLMADTDLGNGGEIDWDKFEEDFDKEFSEEPPAEPETTEPPAEPEPTEPPATEPPAEPEVKSPVQTPEANKAFQELRVKAEQNQRFADFVQKMADKSGVSPEEFLKAVADQELEAEAKAKGQDPELYKRVHTVESKLSANEAALENERFNNQVNLAMAELKITPEQVGETFRKAIDMQLNPRTIPFQTLHKLVNPPVIDVEKIKEQTRQEYLEELKQKQENFVPPSSFSPTPGSASNVDDDVMAFLKEKGDI